MTTELTCEVCHKHLIIRSATDVKRVNGWRPIYEPYGWKRLWHICPKCDKTLSTDDKFKLMNELERRPT